MKKNYTLIIIWMVLINSNLLAQEQEVLSQQNFMEVKATDVATNTFISYNRNIIENEKFRFRRAMRIAKRQNFILEYITDNERIIMSRWDYLKVLKRTLNQSESSEIFIKKMQELFPSQNNEFLNSLNLELLYEQGRKRTLNGYLDGLKYLD